MEQGRHTRCACSRDRGMFGVGSSGELLPSPGHREGWAELGVLPTALATGTAAGMSKRCLQIFRIREFGP